MTDWSAVCCVGDRSGVVTVASPVCKQVFALATGDCLGEPGTAVTTYPVRVRVRDGIVEVGSC